ncbi:acyl-CoA dehydrogenase family protein [Haliea sp.]
MIDDLILDAFVRLLRDSITPATVRQIDSGKNPERIWSSVVESGYLDVLLSESRGGAGISLAGFCPLVTAVGEYLFPLPIVETMLARAVFDKAGITFPAELFVGILPVSGAESVAAVANAVLTREGSALVVRPVSERSTGAFGLGKSFVDYSVDPMYSVEENSLDLLACGAALTAAKIAGGLSKVLEMSLLYVSQREQFGRSLSNFQVIQHRLAVAAEHVVAVNLAARIGLSGDEFHRGRVAVAKTRASEAVPEICGMAHAVHGAIGITEEYDLQLYTRRLREWQLCYGSDSYWARCLGELRLEASLKSTPDFVRSELQEQGEECE